MTIMRLVFSIILCAFGLSLIAVPAASAVPPAAHQYRDDIPGPGGEKQIDGEQPELGNQGSGNNKSGNGSGSNGASGQGSDLTDPSNSDPNAVGQSGSEGNGLPGAGGSSTTGNGTDATGETHSRTPEVQRSSIGGSSRDLGWLFPALMIVSALGIAGHFIYRHRSQGSSNL